MLLDAEDLPPARVSGNERLVEAEQLVLETEEWLMVEVGDGLPIPHGKGAPLAAYDHLAVGVLDRKVIARERERLFFEDECHRVLLDIIGKDSHRRVCRLELNWC